MPNYPYDDLGTPLDATNLERLNNNYDQIQADIQSVSSASTQAVNALETEIDGKLLAQKNEYTGRLDLQKTIIDNLVVDGDSSPEAAQARVGFDGTDYPTLKDRIDTEMLEKPSGSPKGVYATLTALQTAKPNGDDAIYLVTETGNWYYFKNSSWTSGGTYQSTGIANDSVTYKKIKRTSSIVLSDDLSIGNKIPNKYVHNLTGVETNYPNSNIGGVTGFISVQPQDVVRYFGYTSTANLVGWIYNASQQPLTQLTSPATNNSFAEMTMPANAAFVRVNYSYASEVSFSVKKYELELANLDWLRIVGNNIPNKTIVESALSDDLLAKINIPLSSIGIEKLKPETISELQTTQIEDGGVTLEKLSQSVIDFIQEPSTPPVNPFDGDNSTWVGDSITQGTGTTSTTKRFSNIVANALSFSTVGFQNLGVGGSTITRKTGETIKSFVQRICDENQISSNRDRIFVLGGVNDYGQNIPLSSQDTALGYFQTNGSWNDTTFYGALNRLITHIRNTHNNAELVFFTPMHYELEIASNSQGLKMSSYVNAIREVCTYYAVPYIDLWEGLPIDPKDAGHKAKYTLNGTLTAPDGIHPNDLANAMIAKKTINFLKYQYIV